MDADDRPVGRLLSRREALALLGATGGAMLTGSIAGQAQQSAGAVPAPACVVRPAQEEGPYFLDRQLNRSDIRSDPSNGAVKSGVPLALTMIVSRIGTEGCTPLPDAVVDLWHCDVSGAYSGVRDELFDTVGQKFLRGYQKTDASGQVRFVTIYPGWYPIRTVHMHFKIRTDPGSRRGKEFTSQLYFDDRVTDRVHATPPYVARGMRPMNNTRDVLFAAHGRQLMLAPTPDGDGYSATFPIGLAL
jgi:protocatechuate 3,4-dioxygenase beta subunit